MSHEVNINKTEWDKYDNEKSLLIKDLPERYKVTYQQYKCNIPENHYWKQMEIIVYKDNEHMITIGRNYHSPAISIYAQQNNQEFIITSGDYMCITIINLTKGTVESYTDEEQYKTGDVCCPFEFCEWNENKSELIFKGCIWGGPVEKIILKNIDLDKPTFDWSNVEYDDDE